LITRADEHTPVLQTDGIFGTRIGFTQGCEYVKLSLAPGRDIAEHAVDIPVTFYVLQGDGTIVQQDEQIHVSKGELIWSKFHLTKGKRQNF
jgi:quercetin dioxygenase-like cupin family protein